METKKSKIFIWILQILAAAIFIFAGGQKFYVDSHNIFASLGMEPHGRYIIGACELVAGFFLLSGPLAAAGAFLGVGVMIGAIIAHSTVLGVDIGGDGGMHIVLLAVVLLSCVIVTIYRRKELPLIGGSL